MEKEKLLQQLKDLGFNSDEERLEHTRNHYNYWPTLYLTNTTLEEFVQRMNMYKLYYDRKDNAIKFRGGFRLKTSSSGDAIKPKTKDGEKQEGSERKTYRSQKVFYVSVLTIKRWAENNLRNNTEELSTAEVLDKYADANWPDNPKHMDTYYTEFAKLELIDQAGIHVI